MVVVPLSCDGPRECTADQSFGSAGGGHFRCVCVGVCVCECLACGTNKLPLTLGTLSEISMAPTLCCVAVWSIDTSLDDEEAVFELGRDLDLVQLEPVPVPSATHRLPQHQSSHHSIGKATFIKAGSFKWLWRRR